MVALQSADTLEHLSRLASKPGVQSTLILSKSDGSIIRSTGFLAASKKPAEDALTDQGMLRNGTAYNGDHTTTNGDHDPANQSRSLTAEDVAKRVFTFVNSATAFAAAMEEGDDVKLLRMRSKKNEIVIVPGERPYGQRPCRARSWPAPPSLAVCEMSKTDLNPRPTRYEVPSRPHSRHSSSMNYSAFAET